MYRAWKDSRDVLKYAGLQRISFRPPHPPRRENSHVHHVRGGLVEPGERLRPFQRETEWMEQEGSLQFRPAVELVGGEKRKMSYGALTSSFTIIPLPPSRSPAMCLFPSLVLHTT